MGVRRFEPSDTAIWMYEKGGLSVRDIAPMFGVSESTVKRWVRAAGVVRRPAGRPLQDECHNGHDLAEWRRRDKSGNPYCLLCKRERDRNNYRRRHGQEDLGTEEAQVVRRGE